jgi:hypothetical protein
MGGTTAMNLNGLLTGTQRLSGNVCDLKGRPLINGFHALECNHPNFVTLCEQANRVYASTPGRGKSPQNIADRLTSVAAIFSALATQGRDGLPVSIALEVPDDEGKANKDRRFPTGTDRAVKALTLDGWIVQTVKGNPTGNTMKAIESAGAMAYPKESGRAVAGAYVMTAKAWDVLGDDFDLKTITMLERDPLQVQTKEDTKRGVTNKITGEPETKTKTTKKRIPPSGRTTEDLKALRLQIRRYNESLSKFEFKIGDRILHPASFMLRRSFSSVDYLKGGRYYSDFENLTSAIRMQLNIDGEPVVYMDFKNLHGRLSLAVAGEPVPTGDLYQVDGFSRDEVKEVWSAALCAQGNGGVTGTTKQEQERSKRILEALKARHPALKQSFGTGLGLRLQRADSEGVSILLDAFQDAERPIIPIHDGFLVAAGDVKLFKLAAKAAPLAIFRHLERSIIMHDTPAKKSPKPGTSKVGSPEFESLRICPLPIEETSLS